MSHVAIALTPLYKAQADEVGREPHPGPATGWTRKDQEESPTKRSNSWFLEFSCIGKVFRRGGKLYFQSFEEGKTLFPEFGF